MTGGLTVAKYVIDQLAAWNIKRIYGVIGDATLQILHELASQDDIDYIACRHECGAALMASAEAKLTGNVNVCLATSGPGIANLLNGLGDAAADRAPVLAITGQVATTDIGTRAKQYIDQQRLIEPIADVSVQLAHPAALPEMMRTLYDRSRLHGAVAHLSIPKDLLTARVPDGVRTAAHYFMRGPLPAPDLSDVIGLIRSARNPVLYIGRGAESAAEHLVRFAETIQAAVITSLPARPLFPNDHHLYCGGLGQAGSEAATELLEQSDLILMLGATWWPEDYVPKRTKIIQFDLQPENIGVAHANTNGVVGDLQTILPALLSSLESDRAQRSEWQAQILRRTQAWSEKIRHEASRTGSPIPPQAVIQALSKTIPEQAVICVDTGDHTLWFNRIFQAKPGHRIAVSGRWRTLGFALPAAIAAKLANPELPVAAIAGDGGAVQTLMEFQTAAERSLPIVMIVMNNGCYAMEQNRMESGGLHILGSQIVNPDFVKIAEACRGIGIAVNRAEALEEALSSAFRAQKPVLIDVSVTPERVPHTKL